MIGKKKSSKSAEKVLLDKKCEVCEIVEDEKQRKELGCDECEELQ